MMTNDNTINENVINETNYNKESNKDIIKANARRGVIVIEIDNEERTFVMGKIKARFLKTAIEISEKFQKKSFESKDLDDFVSFFCECYNNQFTIDDVYDGIEAKNLLPLIGQTIAAITGKMGES